VRSLSVAAVNSFVFERFYELKTWLESVKYGLAINGFGYDRENPMWVPGRHRRLRRESWGKFLTGA